jgi:hypothetical protein
MANPTPTMQRMSQRKRSPLLMLGRGMVIAVLVVLYVLRAFLHLAH